MDTIFKNISVRATYNELIFDSSMAGFDDLDVLRRSCSTDFFGENEKFTTISLGYDYNISKE